MIRDKDMFADYVYVYDTCGICSNFCWRACVCDCLWFNFLVACWYQMHMSVMKEYIIRIVFVINDVKHYVGCSGCV